jgi:hypothetical protein
VAAEYANSFRHTPSRPSSGNIYLEEAKSPQIQSVQTMQPQVDRRPRRFQLFLLVPGLEEESTAGPGTAV